MDARLARSFSQVVTSATQQLIQIQMCHFMTVLTLGLVDTQEHNTLTAENVHITTIERPTDMKAKPNAYLVQTNGMGVVIVEILASAAKNVCTHISTKEAIQNHARLVVFIWTVALGVALQIDALSTEAIRFEMN